MREDRSPSSGWATRVGALPRPGPGRDRALSRGPGGEGLQRRAGRAPGRGRGLHDPQRVRGSALLRLRRADAGRDAGVGSEAAPRIRLLGPRRWIIRSDGGARPLVAALALLGGVRDAHASARPPSTPRTRPAPTASSSASAPQCSHVVWILGGGSSPDGEVNGIHLWRAMAERLRRHRTALPVATVRVRLHTTLMSFHCYRSSSVWFHEDPVGRLPTCGAPTTRRGQRRAWLVAERLEAAPTPGPPQRRAGLRGHSHQLRPGAGPRLLRRLRRPPGGLLVGLQQVLRPRLGSDSVYRMWKDGPSATFRRQLGATGWRFPGARSGAPALKNMMLSRPLLGRSRQDVAPRTFYDPWACCEPSARPTTDGVRPQRPRRHASGPGWGVRGEAQLKAWWFDPRTGGARLGSAPTRRPRLDAPGEPGPRQRLGARSRQGGCGLPRAGTGRR